VLRAQWDTHWTEEWARLYPERISLYRNHTRKPCCKIAMADVLYVNAVAPDELPFLGFWMLRVETAGRVWVLACRTDVERKNWIEKIKAQAELMHTQEAEGNSRHAVSSDNYELSDAREIYLARSYRWGPDGKRVVLNNRRLLRRPPVGPSAPPPCLLVARLLHMALNQGEHEDYASASAFLDGTVELQGVDLEGLTHDEKLAFWLNLYHCMLIHAFMIVGPPTSLRAWPHFFTRMCYEVGGTVVSLAEVEHCILRRPMSQPRSYYMSPKRWHEGDARQRFVLHHKEPRVNFVLNCGSLSCPSRITVFTAEDVDAQLNEASSFFLLTTVTVNEDKREITLPKVCEWFTDDFGFTPLDCVRFIRHISDLSVGDTNMRALRALSHGLKKLLPEAKDSRGRTRDSWEGKMKFGALVGECHARFEELILPSDSKFSRGYSRSGNELHEYGKFV